MCDCSGTCGCILTFPKGEKGETGSAGGRGEYGGYASNWLFSASTGSGAASTEIRLNNAAPASVTTIYLNDANADATDVSGFLASMSNGGDYGHIRIFDELDSDTFAMYDVTGVTDNTTEYAITVSYIEHNGTFTALDSVVVSFADAGAAGAAGAAGVNGTTVLSNNMVTETTTSASIVLVGTKTYTMPADTLAVNGDKIRITAMLSKTTAYLSAIQLLINANWFTAAPLDIPFLEGHDEMHLVVEASRKSNTELVVSLTATSTSSPSYVGQTIFKMENPGSLGVLDLTGATCVIALHGSIVSGGTLTAEQLTIEKSST